MFYFLILSQILLIYASTEVIVILGCTNNKIQKERVNSALNYINKSKSSKIVYLSGGIKNEIEDKISESSKMFKLLKNKKINAQIIIDEKSKNTAQNLINLKKWIKLNSKEDMLSYVIITSDFHKERVLSIFKKIFLTDKVKFILSKSNCNNCWKDEEIHKKNIHSDIMEALIHFD